MSDVNIGRVLAQKYELVRLLGQGGMGAVYEGRNQIGKRVAIKLLLKPELARDLTARFFREAQASAAVESRHVVDVYDTGVDGDTGFPFIVMAYLNGEDLEHVVQRTGALNPVAAVRIASQAAAGLAKAHEAGIVHRDMKPANIFLAKDEGESVVKILDFGIAKLAAGNDTATTGGGHALTQTGALVGTPLYMSPEQAQGLKTIDARTDVWSLGMCLYQALAGRLPFGDVDTIGKLIVAIVSLERAPLLTLAPWVRPDLAAVVERALERDVNKRFASARDLITALSPFTNGTLAVTADILVGVRQTLDATLAPGASGVPMVGISGASQTPMGTTASLSSQHLAAPAAKASRKTVPLLAAGAVLGLAAVVGVRSFRTTDARPVATSPSIATPPPSVTPATPATPAPASAEEGVKVGVLSLKIPDGFTVKVDGFSPGSPETQGVARSLDDGKLELRGEFQRKFLVAVFDKSGKRTMVQDVYLYDNRLDPETIDTSVGIVAVEKPKRRPAAAGAASTANAHPASSGDLPARF